MLRSDLMLESGCPELSPRALRTAAGEDRGQDAGAAVGQIAGANGAAGVGTAAGTGSKEEEHREVQLSRVTKEPERRATGAQSAYCCWKQVEINTIASGFGHLGPASKTIQRCCSRAQCIHQCNSAPRHHQQHTP